MVAICVWSDPKTIGPSLKCAFQLSTGLLELHEVAHFQPVPFACTACAFDIDDSLDRLDSALTLSAFQDNLRARLSGTLDLGIYHFEQPAPGLINSDIDTLFNPRLT